MHDSGDAALRLHEIDALLDVVLGQHDDLERRSAAILAQNLPAAPRTETPAGDALPFASAGCQPRLPSAA
jgi:hypothetical protein